MVSRRALMARVAAAAPLAAIVQQASAERPSNAIGTSADGKSAPWMPAAASNTVLGSGKGGVKPGFEPAVVTKSVGRDSLIDEWGSAAPSGKAALAAASPLSTGTKVPSSAYDRLLK